MTDSNVRAVQLRHLRDLEGRVNELREELGLHRPGTILTWYTDASGEREYAVAADGYGRFQLRVTEGRNPLDFFLLRATTYDDEDAACAAARRLAEHGVAWDDRDTPIPEDEDDDD